MNKNHIISGNCKDGYVLKCNICGKIWNNKTPNKSCSKECYIEGCRKRMKENNPLQNLEIRKKHKISCGTLECREKKRKYALENNSMKKHGVREKHKASMSTMSGKNNPLYTNPNALENLRNSARTKETREKKSIGTRQSYLDGKHPMCFIENKLKVSISNSKQYTGTNKYIDYYHKVDLETKKSLIKHKKDIKNYELRGRKNGFDLDHRFSVSEGFKNEISPKVIGHWKNLEILPKLENESKYTKCSISLNDLLNLIKIEGA